MEKDEYLVECIKLLKYFGKDLSKDEIRVHDGDYSIICNPSSEFYKLFGGHSIYEVARFVAEELGKRIKFID